MLVVLPQWLYSLEWLTHLLEGWSLWLLIGSIRTSVHLGEAGGYSLIYPRDGVSFWLENVRQVCLPRRPHLALCLVPSFVLNTCREYGIVCDDLLPDRVERVMLTFRWLLCRFSLWWIFIFANLYQIVLHFQNVIIADGQFAWKGGGCSWFSLLIEQRADRVRCWGVALSDRSKVC